MMQAEMVVVGGDLDWPDSGGDDEKWLHFGFTLKAGPTKFADRSVGIEERQINEIWD